MQVDDTSNPLRLVKTTPTTEHLTGEIKNLDSIMSLGDALMYAKSKPEPKWVVPGYVTDGLTLFAGASKVGKSFMCLDIAASVAAGCESRLGPVCEHGDVLYIAAEDSAQRVVSRMSEWNPNMEDWPMGSLSLKFAPMAKTGGEYTQEWIESVANPRLVILDTLARTVADGDVRKGAYKADVDKMAKVQEFAHASGVPVLVVTHTNQVKMEEGSDWMDKVSGTTGIIGTADNIMFLNAKRGEAEGTLHITGRDVPDRADVVRRVGSWWSVFDGPLVGSLGDLSVQITDWVCAQDAPCSAPEVGDALNVPHKTVGTYLGRLAHSGRLSRVGRGRYWKPE